MPQARQRLAERLTATLQALFSGLESWRDSDKARFVRQAVPLVRAAQQSVADLVALRVSAEASRATGRTVAPVVIPAAAITDLRGVDPAEVYVRPFATLRTALSQGHSLTEAVQRGMTRLSEIAEGDLQQTYAHANREAMNRLPPSSRPRSWRRVLVGEQNCALCIVAASNRYSLAELNPIHPGCDCEVAGVWGDDEQQAADDAALQRVHEAVRELTGRRDAGGRAVDYRKLMIKDHGELGPMLVRPRDDFTGPGEIPS